MKKLLIILVCVGAAGYGGLHFYKQWKSKAKVTETTWMSKTAPVEPKDISFSIDAAGDIGPADQVSVRPEINGRIALLPVDLGDGVKKGAVLFTLDDKDLQIERESKMTEIDGAKLQVERARRNFERSKELFEEKLISQELFEDTKTEFELSKNSLEKSQKSLALLEDRLTKTQVLAPFDCTILTRPVSAGQAVSGSGGFNSGTEVLTIANLNEMIINAHINQADVARLTVDHEVDIQVDSVPGLKMSGKIDRIAPQATIKNGIKGFAVRIQLKNIDPRVRPGMTANIKIPVSSAENVLAIPLAAVFTDREGRYAYVKKATDPGYELRRLQVGLADLYFAEIQNGLAAGDEVFTEKPPGAEDPTPSKGQGRPNTASAPGAGGAPAATPPRTGNAGATPQSPTRPAASRPTSSAAPTLQLR